MGEAARFMLSRQRSGGGPKASWPCRKPCPSRVKPRSAAEGLLQDGPRILYLRRPGRADGWPA